MSSSPHSTIVPSDSDINDAILPPQVITALPAVLPPSPMPPKRTSTSAAPTMTEAAIRQLITDGVTAALEAQAAAMANADNPNRNTGPREIPKELLDSLKQKAKIDWLEAGDSNSSYFHKSIKCRNQQSRIEVVVNSDNIEVSGSHVPEVFVSHYEQFLGTSIECNELNVEGLFSKSISATTSSNMVCGITNDEIKAAMLDIGDDKAPGPDGYTSTIFKKGWSVVGHDVCNAVWDFFLNGCILKEINHTFLALIPKVSTLLKINDYRPISCCNVIYKCISKILSNRIIEGIKEVVSDNQATFVPGRRISDIILITQELMHSYHRNRSPPRCAFNVDIQKAYDTVDWRFLETVLVRFGFHCTMVKWIMACVTSTSFHLNINSNIHGFFKGKRGLRQYNNP
ncbi:aspartic peptidase [Tanacetum coccineum]